MAIRQIESSFGKGSVMQLGSTCVPYSLAALRGLYSAVRLLT